MGFGAPTASGTVPDVRRGGLLRHGAALVSADPITWTCYAKPAATGKTCGAVTSGVWFNGNLCCHVCGCTKVASDARVTKQ